MRISRFSDYAVRVLMYTALRAPARVTVEEVAETFGISHHHLTKVVHKLGRQGYLRTSRGVRGGFQLARPAGQIRLGEVIRSCESEASVVSCEDRGGRPCRLVPSCVLKQALDEAAGAFYEVLDRYTLADLTARGPIHQILLPR
ncbi:MAG: Rrf2 family transcriptional regulator [Limisphaera sp.]|nr:Rrf2 family transcriptional regulator [Limisphaera sp.]